MVRKALLVCGFLSSLRRDERPWRDAVGGLQLHLSGRQRAVGDRRSVEPLWVPLGILYQVLVTLFGCAVWASAGRNRPLRLVGGLLLAYGVVGLAAPFFPMHQRGTERTLTDTMHKSLTMVTVLFMLSAVGFSRCLREAVPPLLDRDDPGAPRIRRLDGSLRSPN